jgi:tetratricopeptide (TPR) repeat protein/opacity protein-like surface antigen
MFIALGFPAYAGAGGSCGVEFLRLGGGARPLGMGEAYVALADDSSSMFYNPAGLANMQFAEVLTMSNNWFAGITQQLAGVAYPTNYGVFALGYSGLASGDIQGYGATGEVASVFNTSSSSLNLSFGRRINSQLVAGFGIKSVSEKLADTSASAMALDAGLQYRVNPNIDLGLSIMNLGSGLTFVSENTPLPTSYRAGGAYCGKLFGEDVNLAADLASFPDGTKLNLGVEYFIREILSLRLGSSGGTMRMGLGIVSNMLGIDYAYMANDDLGATHQVSLSILFGAAEQRKKLVLENMALGKAYLKEKRYADAILRFERVMALDPTNEEASLNLKLAQSELETEALRKVFAEKEVEAKRTIEEIIASGKQFMKEGKYIEALAEFGKALKIDPTHPEAVKLQSEAQYRMETSLIEKSKEEAREFLGEAMKLVVTGKYKEALAQINLALEKDPKNKEALALKKKLELILKVEQE